MRAAGSWLPSVRVIRPRVPHSWGAQNRGSPARGTRASRHDLWESRLPKNPRLVSQPRAVQLLVMRLRELRLWELRLWELRRGVPRPRALLLWPLLQRALLREALLRETLHLRVSRGPERDRACLARAASWLRSRRPGWPRQRSASQREQPPELPRRAAGRSPPALAEPYGIQGLHVVAPGGGCRGRVAPVQPVRRPWPEPSRSDIDPAMARPWHSPDSLEP